MQTRRGDTEIRHRLIEGLFSFIAVLLLFCSIPQARAAEVPLAWDPSPSTNISGYKVYVGSASGEYDATITLGNQTAYTVTRLGTGTWYFAVTAFDNDGNESDFSNEVSQTISPAESACNINGDESVNAMDLEALANVVLGLGPTSSNYDLNNDRKVDALDLQILTNVILGIRSCP
jgi:hypothetical protein